MRDVQNVKHLIVAMVTPSILIPENSNFSEKMMLKLKNSKPYFSSPI